jgi:PIN domain nuclease of toxin-antitoxin system
VRSPSRRLLLVAQAMQEGLDILTSDISFAAYKVRTIW